MTFMRIDHGPVPAHDDEPWLVCPVRDERAILPDFLRHYRSLGMKKLCFIDNGSIDGSREYLTSQPDCIVFHTDELYKDSKFAAEWVNRVISILQISGWLILSDADEHLCYSGMEHHGIHALLHRSERYGADSLYGVMVDMYSSGSFMDVQVRSNDRLNRLMPYFDTDYLFRPWRRAPWKNNGGSLQILGGPRCRLLVTLTAESRRSWVVGEAINQVDRFIGYVPQKAMPWLARIWPREVPAHVKAPINFVRPGFRFQNSHSSTNSKFSNELVSLLHYKFCDELQARLKTAANEGNHFRRGLSYLQLQQALQRWKGKSLIYQGSRRFQSSDDLDDVGLTGTRAAAVWESGFTKEFRTGAGPDSERLPIALSIAASASTGWRAGRPVSDVQ